MLDLTEFRKDQTYLKAAILKKDPAFDVDALFLLDEHYRNLLVEVEALRKEKNDFAQQAKSGVTPEIREKSIQIGKSLKIKEQLLQEIEVNYQKLLLSCPNIVHESVPSGNKESNKQIKIVGKKKDFDFEIKDHVQLATNLGWVDFPAATKITGSNFVFYKEHGAKVIYALTRLMLQNNMKHGFEMMLPPYLVNSASMITSGNLPKFAEGSYKIHDEDLYLIPTSEVSLLNYYRDTIFLASDLPKRVTSWTSCFRREAGTYGHAERGLIRIHQFEKVELVSVTKPEDSAAELERMLACAESILQQLGLHYRVMLLAAQDTSFQSHKTYDLEVWMPGQKSYYEVSSLSNCTDFQARRGKIRYRDRDGGKTSFVHTLNASSLALPRLMVALLETYQQKDGSVLLPDCLKEQGWL
ncbi:serine--tRNA ligase [Candidatus Dependentiae bacterium]|nr:serine--tRNA ligase [Candidatus Dependentiae bacterium]